MCCLHLQQTLHNRPRILRRHVFRSSVLFFRSFIASLLSLLITYDCSLQITSQMPNHPANSFYYPRLKELPPIASIKITRQSRSADRQTVMSNHIMPNTINQRFSGEKNNWPCVLQKRTRQLFWQFWDLLYKTIHSMNNQTYLTAYSSNIPPCNCVRVGAAVGLHQRCNIAPLWGHHSEFTWQNMAKPGQYNTSIRCSVSYMFLLKGTYN